MIKTAPILLFTYKRLDTLKQTVQSLLQNSLAVESDLYIYSDGAKLEKDREVVEQVRAYIKTIGGFKQINIIESVNNKGLATSIIDGVTAVLKSYDRVIVLEDDLQTTSNFLYFMNTCLEKYEQFPNAFSVSGYSFNLGIQPGNNLDAYFLNRGWSWGWATWKDRWEKVDWQVKDYSEFVNDHKVRNRFARGGSDLNRMLDKQMSGELDSWAIRWFYHQFRIQGLTVYPVHSKVLNDGFDQFATHTNGSDKRYYPLLDTQGRTQFKLPDSATIHPYYQKRFQKKMGIWARVISKIDTILKRILK